MEHTILTGKLLQSTLGDDLGILSTPGLQSAPSYVMQIVGPSFHDFNWADGGPGLPNYNIIFALADHFQIRESLSESGFSRDESPNKAALQAHNHSFHLYTVLQQRSMEL